MILKETIVERILNTCTQTTLHTPIIDLKKADIIRRGSALGVDYALTVSCYQADQDGRACGVCDSCRLRKAGFAAAGIADPTYYVT